MSTELRNVPGCQAQNELRQTRFWGGKNRMTCLQVTNRKGDYLQLDKFQARALAVELMLFAEGREVEEVEEFNADGTWIFEDDEGNQGIRGDNGVMIQIRG